MVLLIAIRISSHIEWSLSVRTVIRGFLESTLCDYLGNISPASSWAKKYQHFTSEPWFTNHLLRSLSSTGMISYSLQTARLCQGSSESSPDLEGKAYCPSVFNWFNCLPTKVGSKPFWFFLPNFLHVGDVTSRQPPRGLSEEFLLYWDFIV